MNLEPLLQIAVGVGGLAGLASLTGVILQRSKIHAEAKKSGADTAQVLADAAADLLTPYREQVGELRVEVRGLRGEVSALRRHVDQLDRLLLAAGISPPPFLWPPVSADNDLEPREQTNG